MGDKSGGNCRGGVLLHALSTLDFVNHTFTPTQTCPAPPRPPAATRRVAGRAKREHHGMSSTFVLALAGSAGRGADNGRRVAHSVARRAQHPDLQREVYQQHGKVVCPRPCPAVCVDSGQRAGRGSRGRRAAHHSHSAVRSILA